MFKVYNITKDSYISKRSPEQNQGKSGQLYITSGSKNEGARIDPHEDKRTLIDFNAQDIINDIGSGSIGDYTFKLRFFLSDLRLAYNDFSVSAYPISGSWDEGIGDEFETNIGVSWKYRGLQSQYTFDETENDYDFVTASGSVKWDSEGGDYNTGSIYNSTIDRDNMIMETDITNYIDDVNSGSSDNGLIYIADKVNYNMSMYSSDTVAEMEPYVVAYKDDYIVTGSAVQFDGDKSNIVIRPLHYKRVLQRGQQFNMLLEVESQYRVAGFTYSRELEYVEDVKYRIFYNSSKYEFVPYSEFTKVPIKGQGLTLSFSTENFPRGSYYIEFMYEDPNSGAKTYSDKHYFRVE